MNTTGPGTPVGPPPPPPPPLGPGSRPSRRAALEERRYRARRRRRVVAGLLGLLLMGGLVLGGYGLIRRESGHETPPPGTESNVTGPSEATTTLLVGTRGPERQPRLVWLSLLVHDRARDRSAVAYIPARTAAEIPGRGLQTLRSAFDTGGMRLLRVSVENLLGAPIDRHVALTRSEASEMFKGYSATLVEVPDEVRMELPDGDVRVLFAPGPQELGPVEAATLLFTYGEGGDDLDLGHRHLALWAGLFGVSADGSPGDGTSLIEAEDIPAGTEERRDELAAFFSSFFSVEQGRAELRTLPVAPLEVPGDPFYVVDEEELRSFVTALVGPEQVRSDAIRVQILNGNGEPGIGQEVAERLVGQGFRVSLTGNARRMDHRRTLVITYDRSPEGREIATRITELLGVGEVQISAQEQGIVDLTIVVGRDFLRAR